MRIAQLRFSQKGISMKRAFFLSFFSLLLASCQNSTSSDQVVFQKFVHKYGFDLSEKEWEEGPQEGQVISMLKNGVKVASSYEDGKLHGEVTHTFPHSDVIEKRLVYGQGTLLKETVYDLTGMPMREEVYEFDDRTITTFWNEEGIPLSIEEYEGEKLINGTYYTPDHELEGRVEGGFGLRVKRDRSGLLLLSDQIENGWIVSRTTYHPTGQPQTISHYKDYQLHGEQLKYTSTGKPLMQLHWNRGVLDGWKVVFRNGSKIAEIPYINGKKEGIEYHYDDLGNLTAEIQWKKDKKHGCSKYYTDEATENEWFFKGQSVTAKRFQALENRNQLIADLSGE